MYVGAIIFSDDNFSITNKNCPGFLKSYTFQDEYEANLAWAIWLQYSKKSEKLPSGIRSAEGHAFQWIIKAIFRIIGIKSEWM